MGKMEDNGFHLRNCGFEMLMKLLDPLGIGGVEPGAEREQECNNDNNNNNKFKRRLGTKVAESEEVNMAARERAEIGRKES